MFLSEIHMCKILQVLSTVLALLLAVFFLFGAYGNFFLNEENAQNYAAWGYPDWFHYITAIVEFTASMLLLSNHSRVLGAALGAAVMAAATLTTIWNADYDHSIAPAIVMAFSLIVLGLSLRVAKQAG